MNKKGFTLLELLIIVLVLCIIFLTSIKVVETIISNSKYGAFENSVYSAIDAVDLYIVNNNWSEIPAEGLEISALDKSILKNNNFSEGVFVRENGQVKMLYIKQDNYCAKGTKDKLITTDKGCGALDETKPLKSNLFLKESTNDAIYIVAEGYDSESKIIKYEISVDDNAYYTNSDSSYNVFEIKLDDFKEHSFKVRVTNEAGLKKVSEIKKFKKTISNNIIIKEQENKENVQIDKSFIFNTNNKTTYEYSYDLEKWFKYDNNIEIDSNKIVYIKITNGDNITYNTLNINNIDSFLNGAYPVLSDGMIPVIYDGKNWVVANKNTSYWDYENSVFANVVFVKKNKDNDDSNSHSRNYYLSDEAIGSVVYEKDILAFYVWIPRYKYKLWDNNSFKITDTIDIVFENKNNEISIGKSDGEFITHKAFNYYLTDGFWVSKYEASPSISSNCYLLPNIDNCNRNDLSIYSLENRNSIKYISISNASVLSSNLNGQFNIYGLDNKTTPHLMTNLEWGATAYLMNSKFTDKENITVVKQLDETGEYVFGNYNKDLGLDENDNSGFKPYGNNEWPTYNFIDIYKSISIKGAILGDATLEVKNLNATNEFINGENPFIVRGIYNMYSYNNSTGSTNENITFRPVISNIQTKN